MSFITRIALVIRSYVKSAGDRIDRIAAEEELRAAEPLLPTASIPTQTPTVQSPQSTQLASDYAYLGLDPGANLAAVEAAWRRLAARADPKRFPSGSEEEKQAARILESLNESYERLRESLNPTEGRFGQLEL